MYCIRGIWLENNYVHRQTLWSCKFCAHIFLEKAIKWVYRTTHLQLTLVLVSRTGANSNVLQCSDCSTKNKEEIIIPVTIQYDKKLRWEEVYKTHVLYWLNKNSKINFLNNKYIKDIWLMRMRKNCRVFQTYFGKFWFTVQIRLHRICFSQCYLFWFLLTHCNNQKWLKICHLSVLARSKK